jgi:hypothetical protein
MSYEAGRTTATAAAAVMVVWLGAAGAGIVSCEQMRPSGPLGGPAGPSSPPAADLDRRAGTSGVWLSVPEIAALDQTGPAWAALLNEAAGSCGPVRLGDQDDTADTCVLGKALVFSRTGDVAQRRATVEALAGLVGSGSYRGSALALGRNLPAVVIAADLVGLSQHDPDLDSRFRQYIAELVRTPTTGGPVDLIDCHERRPNNWGTHCGAARATVAAYLGDSGELDRVADVLRGWLGDRDVYAGFEYGDRAWQCDPQRPVGINPAGCTRDGHPIGGVLPDDQRRAGPFAWPPSRENYVYEALQGALVQAVVLTRAGYAPFTWGNEALLRAYRWLHEEASFPATGDDSWQMHVVNHYYGTRFPAVVPARPGKNMGWTDWTHGRR